MENGDFYIAGIGASAGGHDALREFFGNFTYSDNVSFVVVTHLLRDHISILDKIISRFTGMLVTRIGDNERVKPGRVYVMPENVEVRIVDGRLFLDPRDQNSNMNRTIDKFFKSLAIDQRDKAIAIIFSGMGSDGAQGVFDVHANGGIVLVQEPRSTEFKSMPAEAIRSDHPEKILPPAELARALHRILRDRKAGSEISQGPSHSQV